MKKTLLLLTLIFVLPNLPYAQIVNIEELRGAVDSLPGQHWHGVFQMQANVAKVQSTSVLVNLDARLQHIKGRNITLLFVSNDLLRGDTKDFTNASFAHLRYNYRLTDDLALELFTQVQVNKLLLIRARSLAGAGLRLRVFRSDDQKRQIVVGSSCFWEQDQFLAPYGTHEWLRSSNYVSISLRFFKDKAHLQGTAYYQPAVGLIKNYRLSTKWLLEMPLSKHFSFTTDFQTSQDHGLPDLAPVRTYAWENGILLQF